MVRISAVNAGITHKKCPPYFDELAIKHCHRRELQKGSALKKKAVI
jgi:hypothetical protein